MGQQVGTTSGRAPHRETLPGAPEVAERGRRETLLGLVLFAMCCVGVGAAEDRPAWGRAILISGAHQEHDVLRATFTHATSRGVETQAAAATLKTLNKYIHQRVAQGKTVTLSQGMMVDTLEAAQRARWSPQDTSDLLLALQADMDAAPRPPVAQFRLAIARVRDGGTVAEAMGTAGLENRAAR